MPHETIKVIEVLRVKLLGIAEGVVMAHINKYLLVRHGDHE